MINKLLILSIITITNVNSMSQKLVLKFSSKQMIRLTTALNSQHYGANLQSILNRTVAQIKADKKRKNYRVTFNLSSKYIGQTADKQKESLSELFQFITAEENSDKKN